jgi:hypothetical protein
LCRINKDKFFLLRCLGLHPVRDGTGGLLSPGSQRLRMSTGFGLADTLVRLALVLTALGHDGVAIEQRRKDPTARRGLQRTRGARNVGRGSECRRNRFTLGEPARQIAKDTMTLVRVG